MFKRMGLFFITNILVVATIGLSISFLGINRYLTANGIDYIALLIMCSIWGFGGSFISLMLSKWAAKSAYRMIAITPEDENLGWVAQSVYNYAKLCGIKRPEVYVYDSEEVNAFATGRSKNSSLVAISYGLLNRMNQDEVEGVLAHEVAHIANGDMVTMALIQGVLNVFVMFFSRVVAFFIVRLLRGDGRNSILSFWIQRPIIFVLDILFGFLSMPVLMWFSRYREYRADSLGAKLSSRESMIAALKNLQNGAMVENSVPNLSSFKISGKQKILSLFSSHPPLEKRIDALSLK